MDEFVRSNQPVHDLLQEHFLLMKVDTDHEEFLNKFPTAEGYPFAYVLDSNGKFLHPQGTAELEEGRGYHEGRFLEFLNRWKPAA